MRPTAFGRENAMFDDFFVRAMVAGIGVALTAGPLGCFVVWRRMAYFGDTMAHSALLGVALSLLLQLNLIVSVFLVASAVSILLIFLQRRQALSSDALLGILSHSALAIGLVIVAFMSWVRIDLVSFLFGDILAVTRSDIALIWGRAGGHRFHGLPVAVAARFHRQYRTGGSRGAEPGTLEADLHIADGAGDRNRHESGRHHAHHLAAHHTGRDRAAFFQHAGGDGGCGLADRRCGRCRRPVRLADL